MRVPRNHPFSWVGSSSAIHLGGTTITEIHKTCIDTQQMITNAWLCDLKSLVQSMPPNYWHLTSPPAATTRTPPPRAPHGGSPVVIHSTIGVWIITYHKPSTERNIIDMWPSTEESQERNIIDVLTSEVKSVTSSTCQHLQKKVSTA